MSALKNSLPYRLLFAGFVCGAFTMLSLISFRDKDVLLGYLSLAGASIIGWSAWFIIRQEYHWYVKQSDSNRKDESKQL